MLKTTMKNTRPFRYRTTRIPSGDDRGAAIAAREASRGRVVEDGGAFMHAFARVLTTGLGIYGALRTPKDGSRAFCDADGNSVAV
ncbi:hypothetical protein PF002_g28271 [Phytophthora fragariae]|uniref:Uncharacterized protein n=2 Tax=Phytophthora fragariae TaxID=53985 RepID=A0A6A4BEX5_9STRA|nr:hypothetical protein PF006_g26866 [Phytophthora fragariae]KAE9177692.1 hypothetical protein PF002_g28271 [Phytophthora fragariae]KAE9271447.1 hypothetical protein PF001_g28372 [Phytophthora fragariae]